MPASRIACLYPHLARQEGPALSRALDALADAAAGFSPEVERAGDAVYLEVGDLGRLFAKEEQLLAALQNAAREVDVEAHIAIASVKKVAAVHARAQRLGAEHLARPLRGALIPCGREQEALSPLPLAALAPSPELFYKLELWGLYTVGEFAALPRPQVATRLGHAGLALHRLACGESDELLQKTPPPLEVREELELLDAIDNLEPLLFVLRGLLDRLLVRLRARGQACGDLLLRLGLAPRGEDTRRIKVAAPTQKVAPLLALVQVALESQPPTATVDRLTIVATPLAPRPTQLDLFAPAGPAPEHLAATLARLEALCGKGRVGQPVVPNSHAPGAADLCPFAPPPPASSPVASSQSQSQSQSKEPLLLLAAQVLRPPQPVIVARRGAELWQVGMDRCRPAKPGSERRSVRRSGGPYRLRDVRGERDYYDVELEDGELIRLFYDLSEGRWFLDAVYD